VSARRPRVEASPAPNGGVSSATGFHSLALDAERAASLSVTGTLPEWLSGVLVRNGPGAFEFGDASVDHWFDGLAMPTRFGLDGG